MTLALSLIAFSSQPFLLTADRLLIMEPLIRALNDPKNQSSPTLIHETQKQLQILQREPSSWQASLDLLHKDEAVMRFYGALTLTIKINADW